jgi:hypothetical protein
MRPTLARLDVVRAVVETGGVVEQHQPPLPVGDSCPLSDAVGKLMVRGPIVMDGA